MVLSKHKKLIELIKLISSHGMTAGAKDRKKQKQPWSYDVATFGKKANMSEVHAAIGNGQLKQFAKDQEKRQKLALRYIKNLKDLNDYFKLPITKAGITHGWHLFVIKLKLDDLKFSRDEFIHKLSKLGIGCGVHYRPVFEFSFYKKILNQNASEFPNATYAGERVVTLPLYPSLKLSDVDYVCQKIRSVLEK